MNSGAPFPDELLGAAFDVARIGICVTDAGGTLVRVNPAFCDLLGYVREEVVGQPFTIATPDEFTPRAREFLDALLAESPRVRNEWRIRRRDGGVLDALVSFRTLSSGTGERFVVVTFTDITERKRADNALKESEERFRQLAEHIGEVFWISDPSKQAMIYVSPAYEKVWGRSVQSLYDAPRSFLDAIHADDRARVVAALPLQPRGGYHEEYRVVRPDGSVRWVRDRAFPVRDAHGRVYRIAGIATDITERRYTVERFRQLNVELESRIAARTEELTRANAKLRDEIEVRTRAEAGLRDVTERIRLLIETANDAVVTIDDTSVIIDWNAAAERMFGWTRTEALGRILTDLIVPARHRPSHHHGLSRFLAAGEAGILNRRVETHALRRDGSEFDVELSVWPVRTEMHFTFSAFIRDISSRKVAETALRQSEERYRAVVENAEEGIIVAQDAMLRFANPKAVALTGRTPEEIYATPFLELIHPEDRARVGANYLRRLKGEAVENQYAFRITTGDGGLRWLQISAVMITWEGRPATLNFLTDVTIRQRIEEELRRALERERELSELKTRFVAMTSHELRTPLAEILSSAELIEDHRERLSGAEIAEVLGIIKRAVKRMNHMVGQVLVLGRGESGALAFRPAGVDIAALCDELATQARRSHPGTGISCVVTDAAGPRLADADLLRHIIGNLLENAVKYAGDAGGIELRLDGVADAVKLIVADRGIGIPPEDRAHLFSTFHRGTNVGNIEGTGLGLAIVKQCVDLHGGRIEVDSAPGQGSIFTVHLPAPPVVKAVP